MYVETRERQEEERRKEGSRDKSSKVVMRQREGDKTKDLGRDNRLNGERRV